MKKTLRAVISAAIAIVMLLSVIPFSVGSAYPTPFEDVKPEDYFYDAVIWAYGEGVTTGTSATKFSPQATCTRGQVVTFLWRTAGKPDPETKDNPFTDVKDSDYYYKPVLWAVENGITTGTDATHFSPSVTCTNAHILTFIWRTLGEPEKTGEGEWYTDAYNWATGAGLLDGTYSGEYDVNAGCPRANVVTYLYRYVESDTLTIYVSAGADAKTADGSVKNPFATIEAARDYLRGADKSGYSFVTVRIAAGNYPISQPIEFTAADSGTSDCPITYKGEEGTTVTGGIVLSAKDFTKATGDFTKYFPESARDKIVMIDMTKHGITPEMITKALENRHYNTTIPFFSADGERQTIAQFPEDWLHIEGAETYDKNGEVVSVESSEAYSQKVNYGEQYAEKVQSWSEVLPVYIIGRFYHLWCPDDSKVFNISKDEPIVDIYFNGGHQPVKGGIMYFYNVPEELDKPGEYIYDENAVLYYYPTEDFETTKFTVPLSDGLVNVNGANYITFENIEFTSSRGDNFVVKGNNITIENCEISAAQDQGVNIKGNNNSIIGCSIHDTGNDAISFESGDIEMIKGGNLLIYNNDIYDYGVTCSGGYGVTGNGVDILVSHNDVHDANFKGVHFIDAVNAIAEYNDVWRVSLLCEDAGVMSADGKQNANIVFRYNYVHDCMPEGEAYRIKEVNPDYSYYGTFAFYYDNGCSYVETYGNVVNNVDTGYLSNGGRCNTCHNNLFMDCHKWYVEFSEWTYGNALGDDGQLHGGESFDSYVYNAAWKKVNPDLAGLICSPDGVDPLNPMLWCAPANDVCHDNYIVYNKADRLFNNWGIRPYNIEGWVEEFSGDTITIDESQMTTYSSKRTEVSIEEALENAQGVVDMDLDTFRTIGRID